MPSIRTALSPITFLWCMLFTSYTCGLVATSVFLPMPQGYYSTHYLRPRDDYQNRCQQPAIISAIGLYHQSFKSDEIARALFNTTQLTFAGSEVPNRQANWIRADDFGLAPDFLGTVRFQPTIRNLSLDLFYHLNLTSWCERLFIELGTTLVNAEWKLNQCERSNRGSLLFPTCEMSGTPDTQTAPNIATALSGCFFFGDMQVPWRAGRFPHDEQSITRLADISAALGLILFQSDTWNLSAALLTLIPTGNKFNATTVFSPLVGNGDHWELGITLQAEGITNLAEDHELHFFASATMTHQFKNLQRRTFDFKGRCPLSRYLLLKKLTQADDGSFIYSGILSNAVNFTTRVAAVRVPIHGDAIFDVTYQHNHYMFQAGYHFYGRAAENVRLLCTKIPCAVQGAFYGVKGTEGTCYRTYSPDPITTEDPTTALNSTQDATICRSGPTDSAVAVPITPTTVSVTWNSNANNATIMGNTIAAVTSDPTFQQAATSLLPHILTTCDLNPASGAAPATIVNTVYMQTGYQWESFCMTPTMLIGAEGSFGRYGTRNALCQWGFWIQFNTRF